MDFSSLSSPTGDLGAQRCLSGFSSELGTSYDSDNIVPPWAMGVRRFTARRIATSQTCFISVRQNSEPLSQVQLEFQRGLLARLSPAESQYLGGLVEGRAEPEANYVVSTLPGLTSLHQLLRQQRRLDVGRGREILTQVAEALEAATAAHWPRVMVDTHALFVPAMSSDMSDSGLKLVVPPLPGAAEMVPGAAGFPVSSNEYVQDLAYLTCELLGMPARRQRFRPLPQLGADANQVLRDVIEGGGAASFGSALEFLAAFTAGLPAEATTLGGGLAGMTTGVVPRAHQPQTTATIAPHTLSTPPTGAGGLSALQTPVPRPVPVAVAPPQPKLPPLAAPPRPEKPLCSHLRLSSPSSPHLPQVGMFLGDQINLGRGAATHFVTQFFPRNPRNDGRTSLISREHVRLSRKDGTLLVEDLPNTNQSFINGRPVPSGSTFRQSCRVTIAGEYDLDMRKVDSWWQDGAVWTEQGETLPPVGGAVVLAPAPGASVLEFRGIWMFTDAAFGLLPTGALNLHPSSIQGALGWFVVLHDGIWVLASENDGSLAVDNGVLKAGVPMPLHDGTLLRVGTQDWRVQSLAPA